MINHRTCLSIRRQYINFQTRVEGHNVRFMYLYNQVPILLLFICRLVDSSLNTFRLWFHKSN